jgi:hypothetical protein
MRKDAQVSPQAFGGRSTSSVSYLVVDEVGFEPMSRGCEPVLPPGEYRYRRQHGNHDEQGVKDWPGILAGTEAMTAAVLHRLLHDSVVLNVR